MKNTLVIFNEKLFIETFIKTYFNIIENKNILKTCSC